MVDSKPASRDGGASETESDQKHAHLRTHPRAEMVILFGLARRPASTQIEKVSLFYHDEGLLLHGPVDVGEGGVGLRVGVDLWLVVVEVEGDGLGRARQQVLERP